MSTEASKQIPLNRKAPSAQPKRFLQPVEVTLIQPIGFSQPARFEQERWVHYPEARY